MKKSVVKAAMLVTAVLCFIFFSVSLTAAQQQRSASRKRVSPAGRNSQSRGSRVAERNVRAHMEFLAGDALQGRGSGSQYELIAGHYIAAQLRQFGIEPAGDANAAAGKTFLQTVALTEQAFAEAPRLSFNVGEKSTEWVHGKEIMIRLSTAAQVSGPLQKIEAGGRLSPGAVALLNLPETSNPQERSKQITSVLRQGAVAVLTAETPEQRQRWSQMGMQLPSLPVTFGDSGDGSFNNQGSSIVLSTDAIKELQSVADGTSIQIKGALKPSETKYTWNVVGQIRGNNPTGSREAVVLSAHMDHLGVGNSTSGDNIYNGADDDASGVIAVLELARALGAGPKPKRTIYFVLFGSEEAGGYGSRYFIARPPVPLSNIVANLQFEMIGRPDPKVAPNTLWLTGFERSNLGPELARSGARLVADPHPSQNFFQRSDNYALARRGVVAHTVSSFGLHKEYHQPDDDLRYIDFAHMTRAISSMIEPVRWLVNSTFKPTWVEGKKP